MIWRRRRDQIEVAVPEAYRNALRMLARHGLVRSSAASARDFARGVRERIPGSGANAFDEITDRYLAERFGQRPPIDLERPLHALKDAVDRMRLRDQPHIG